MVRKREKEHAEKVPCFEWMAEWMAKWMAKTLKKKALIVPYNDKKMGENAPKLR